MKEQSKVVNYDIEEEEEDDDDESFDASKYDLSASDVSCIGALTVLWYMFFKVES